MRLVVVCALALLTLPRIASAHQYDPSLLEIEQRTERQARVRFFPARSLRDALANEPLSIDGCTTQRFDREVAADCASGRLTVQLPAGTGEVLVELRTPSGETIATTTQLGQRITLDLQRPAPPKLLPAIGLGAQHIGGGADHLLFIAALVVLLGFRRRLVLAITGFSLGHSITLALGAYGLLVLPSGYVEALIALSLVVLGRELLRHDRNTTLLHRRPLLMTALFGLVHGCGFAGALQELGLPADGRLPLLLGFNLGVELGQLAFVAALLGAARLLRSLPRLDRIAPSATAYAVGVAGAALLLVRIGQW